MAEETTKTTDPAPSSEGVVSVPPVKADQTPATGETEVSENPAEEKPTAEAEPAAAGETDEAAEAEKITQSVSYKEESNVAGDLPDPESKALEEFKQLLQEALNKHEFTAPPPKEEEKKAPETEKKEGEVKEEATGAEKKEEAKTETTGEEEVAKSETEQKPPEEKVETEAAPPAEPKEEEKPAPPPVTTEVKEVSEKSPESVEDAAAKTVEAIESTVVSSADTAPAAETEQPSASTKTETPTDDPPAEAEVTSVPPPPPEEVFIWGIPLLADERSDVILLKFLRARDFKVKDAFAMLKSTILWRKEFKIEALLEEDLGNEFEKFVFTSGVDKEDHPVCYNVYGAFEDKELYQNTFSDEEKRTKFLRWRVQLMEKSIRKLDFSPTGINTIFQVNDLNNSFWPAKKEIRQTTNQALQLFQDNYPEFVAKQVFINVPWWYLAFNRMISPFLTQRTKSKFVFAGPSKTADTLFKYISPEQVPVQYGGLSKEGEQLEFISADSVTEITIKPATKHTVEIAVSEKSVVVWEFRVVGWEVSYGAEFVPSADDGYTVIVSKTRKVGAGDEPVIGETFKAGEPGKVVLTIDNQSSKKKKLLYRTKTKPPSD